MQLEIEQQQHEFKEQTWSCPGWKSQDYHLQGNIEKGVSSPILQAACVDDDSELQ